MHACILAACRGLTAMNQMHVLTAQKHAHKAPPAAIPTHKCDVAPPKKVLTNQPITIHTYYTYIVHTYILTTRTFPQFLVPTLTTDLSSIRITSTKQQQYIDNTGKRCSPWASTSSNSSSGGKRLTCQTLYQCHDSTPPGTDKVRH